jgi:hypothetical protein
VIYHLTCELNSLEAVQPYLSTFLWKGYLVGCFASVSLFKGLRGPRDSDRNLTISCTFVHNLLTQPFSTLFNRLHTLLKPQIPQQSAHSSITSGLCNIPPDVSRRRRAARRQPSNGRYRPNNSFEQRLTASEWRWQRGRQGTLACLPSMVSRHWQSSRI